MGREKELLGALSGVQWCSGALAFWFSLSFLNTEESALSGHFSDFIVFSAMVLLPIGKIRAFWAFQRFY